MHKQFDEIFQKRMDRKDFLKHVAMGVAVITGTAGVVKLLNPQQQQLAVSQKHPAVSTGYGSSAYGGNPANAPAAQKS